MLSEKQINNIAKLDTETLIEILQECAEALGIVGVDEYCEIMCVKKRNVYYQIESGKIKSINISGHSFPLINI